MTISKRQEQWLNIAEEIPKCTSSTMMKAREKAKNILAQLPLPRYGSEHYKRFDVDTFLEHSWEIDTLATKGIVVNPLDFQCHTMTDDAIQCRYIGGKFYLLQDLPADTAFYIGSFSDFEQRYPQIASRYLFSMASLQKDPLAALNMLFSDDILVIYTPKGIKIDRPIHLVQYTGLTEGREQIGFPHTIVIAEEESEIRLLSCDHSIHKGRYAKLGLIEIYAEEGSRVEYYDVEESLEGTERLHNVHIHQAKKSNVLIESITIQNGSTRNNFYCDLAGEEAILDIDGLCILDGEQKADNWSEILHSVPNCTSDELFKYTVNDRAVGNFSGKIYVAKDAQKTAAYQNNRNLILSKTGKMFSKPQLEIYADDVRCSHGMTTGELSEDALFYLLQRGIPITEARLMLTIAFMSDVLAHIRLDSLRERLAEVVANRFRGIPFYCQK